MAGPEAGLAWRWEMNRDNSIDFCKFLLDASMYLYMRVCPSVPRPKLRYGSLSAYNLQTTCNMPVSNLQQTICNQIWQISPWNYIYVPSFTEGPSDTSLFEQNCFLVTFYRLMERRCTLRRSRKNAVLVAYTWLFKSLCWSVSLSVSLSVRLSVSNSLLFFHQ